MTAITPVYYTLEQAQTRREDIRSEVGDIELFRNRGAHFELDAKELALYHELVDLEYLIGE